MILNDDELYAVAKLRSNILSLLGVIRDSYQSSLRFNDPSPNWLTSSRLKACLKDYEESLIMLGAKRVYLHSPCGSERHTDLASNVYGHGGYWRYELECGLSDADLAANGIIVLDGTSMETVFDTAIANQRTSTRPCPCRLGKTTPEHTVSKYFLWPEKRDSHLAELAEMTLTLGHAIEASQNKKRRSGIRELLLQAHIKLDDMILEENSESVLRRRGIT